MARTYCPNCDAVISVDAPRLGAMVTCECGAELEIISVNPFEVDFPLDYEGEWEEESEEDEEEWEDEESWDWDLDDEEED